MTAVPPDVEAVLGQLFAAAREALDDGDTETAVSAVTSAATVASTKLPEGRLRAQLRHGCRRVETVATDDDSAAAIAYIAAMERRLDAAGE